MKSFEAIKSDITELNDFFLKECVSFSDEAYCSIRDDQFLLMDGAAKGIFGANIQYGGNIYLVIVPNEREWFRKSLEDIRNSGQLENLQVTCINDQNISFFTTWKIRWDKSSNWFFCSIKNINDIKLLERKLKENKGRLKRSESMARLGNWEYDVLNNRCSASDEVYKIYGISREDYPEITPDVFIRFVHEDDRVHISENMKKIIEIATLDIEHKIIRPDGQTIYVHHIGQVKKDQQGNMLHLYGTVQDITERKILQEKLSDELKNRQKQIMNAVISGQERERSKMSKELHDNVNQMLTTVKLYNEVALTDHSRTELLLKKSMDILQNCINEIRNISKQLSAPTLGKISLKESIHELVQSLNVTNKVDIRYDIDGIDELQLPQELHLAIYRIVQEQLNNIIKYAEAKVATIKIENTDRYFKLCIKDDGKGFDTTVRRNGIGITNMISRAESVHGKLVIKSEFGRGCKLQAYFPSLSSHMLVIPEKARNPQYY